MSRVIFGVTCEVFDENAPKVDLTGKELEAAVDEDLARFEKFMMEEVDDSGPLSGPEKAIIKTYIHWKTHATKASSTL
jgi:hypothetical protein